MQQFLSTLGGLLSTAADFETKVKSYLQWLMIVTIVGAFVSILNYFQNSK